MGHKVHPYGFRIGVIRGWQAKWYADKHYAVFLQEDLKLRKAIESRYADAAVSLVEIERQANQVSVTIHTARPGIVIGRGGQRVDETRRYLEQLMGKKVQLRIQDIQQPELDAHLVAKSIAEQMERRVAYRRAMKQVMLRTLQAGAKGVRVGCAGRLGGAEIARRLVMHEGRVPLHTMRADIDYGFVEARTQMGRIGVKVWIYKGEILPEAKVEEAPAEAVAEVGVEVTPLAEVLEEKVTEPAAVSSVPVEAPPEPKLVKVETAPVEEVATAEIASVEEVKEKPAKTVRRRRTKAAPTPDQEGAASKPAPKVSRKAKSAKPEEVKGNGTA